MKPPKVFSKDPLDEPAKQPEHLDDSMPMPLPASVWASMTDVQKENYRKFLSSYQEALLEERRSKKRHQHGY